MRPNFYRSDAAVAVCGAGRYAVSAGRGEDGASESGTLWAREGPNLPEPQMSSRHSSGEATGSPGASGQRQKFTAPNGGGKLKTWKPGILPCV